MHEIIFLRIGPKSIQIRISREETVDSILTCQQKGCLATGIISNKEIYSGGKVNRQLSETSEISNFYLLHSLGLCCKVSKKNLSTQRKNRKTIVSAAISPHAFPPPLRPLREPRPNVKSPTPNSLCQDKAFPRKNHINFALGNEIQTIAASPGVRTDFPRGGQRQTNIHRPTPRRIRRKTYSLYALPPRDPEREQPHAATTTPARSPSDRRTATSAPAWNRGFQPPPRIVLSKPWPVHPFKGLPDSRVID